MASLSCLLSLSPYSGGKNKQSHIPIPQTKRNGVNYVPCKACNVENHEKLEYGEDPLSKLDRRDVLFGLGGLYGVTTLNGNKFALANPLSPDVSNGEKATVPRTKTDCCPPEITEITDFTPPHVSQLRVRRAAQLMTQSEISDFENGIRMMRDLPDHDPRSFSNQANVHCAYCNNAYKQLGHFQKTEFQVHSNALFFPFHRAYLYFFERIISSLIQKPNFALPFWNWDSPDGMYLPEFFDNPKSPLYDEHRDPRHNPPKMVDLVYDTKNEDRLDLVKHNLASMKVQMSPKTANCFLGKVLKAGQTADPSYMGTIENCPHGNVHDWVGNYKLANREDMGNFYSAGRDPVFYTHHANVDRLWNVWKEMSNNRDHTNSDWLNSSFVFYDENRNAVRIKVSDCLNSKNLGYVYEDVTNEWKKFVKTPLPKPWIRTEEPEPPIINFPKNLNSDITTMVDKPEVPRAEEEDVVLVLEDVEYDPTTRVHFDVLINVVNDQPEVGPMHHEFVGIFHNLPHGHLHYQKTSLRFVITDAIQGLGLEHDEKLAVRIEPKVGGETIKIGGIKIQLESLE